MAGREINLWLVEQQKFVVLEGPGDLGRHAQLILTRLEQIEAAQVIGLIKLGCLIECALGGDEQRLDGHPVVRMERRADAQHGTLRRIAHIQRLFEKTLHATGRELKQLGCAAVADQYRKTAAAEPGEEVLPAYNR